MWMDRLPTYEPNLPPPLVGREREVSLIFGHLTALQRGNVAVHGTVGSGKTRLLQHVADPDVHRRYVPAAPRHVLVHLDVQAVSPFSATRFWHRVAHLARRAAPSALSRPATALLDVDSVDIVDVEVFLDAVGERDVALTLLLDEFEWALQAATPADETASRIFLAQLASLARRTPRVLAFVVATEQPLADAVGVVPAWRGSPFSALFTTIALDALDRSASDRMLDGLLGAAQATAPALPDRERDAIHAASQGHPAAIRAAALSLASTGVVSRLPATDRPATPHRPALDAVRASAAAAAAELQGAAVTLSAANARGTRGGPAGVWIDVAAREVVVDGRSVEGLSPLEFDLLALLHARSGRVCSKHDILHQLWGSDAPSTLEVARVEKLVSRLRHKVEVHPGRPQLIRTARGRGYRYAAPPDGDGVTTGAA